MAAACSSAEPFVPPVSHCQCSRGDDFEEDASTVASSDAPDETERERLSEVGVQAEELDAAASSHTVKRWADLEDSEDEEAAGSRVCQVQADPGPSSSGWTWMDMANAEKDDTSWLNPDSAEFVPSSHAALSGFGLQDIAAIAEGGDASWLDPSAVEFVPCWGMDAPQGSLPEIDQLQPWDATGWDMEALHSALPEPEQQEEPKPWEASVPSGPVHGAARKKWRKQSWEESWAGEAPEARTERQPNQKGQRRAASGHGRSKWREQWDDEDSQKWTGTHAEREWPQKWESTYTKAQQRGDRRGSVKPQCQFFIGIEEQPKFPVVRKLLGPHGQHVKAIAEKTWAKLRLRGRGSGFLEGPEQQESTDELMLCVSAPDSACYAEAVSLVTELIEGVYDQYRTQVGQTPELAIRIHEGARPGSR